MKKILFLLLALPTMLMAQQKVAVYVSAPENYGQLKAIQVDGYLLSPMVYKFQVPPMKPKDEIRFNIPRP